MNLDEQLKEAFEKVRLSILTNKIKYGEFTIVVKDNQLHKLTITKEELLNN